MRTLSLSYLTVTGASPVAHVSMAAEAGFDAVGLRLIPPLEGEAAWPMSVGSLMFRETKALLDDTGLNVLDVEMIKLERFADLTVHRAALEAATALGAKHIMCTSNNPDEGFTATQLGRLSELAREYDLRVHFEFMPWAKGASSLDQAARIVSTVGAANLHLMIDAIHFFRCGSDFSGLKSLPPKLFAYMQICDAPAQPPADAEGILEQGRFERLFPGEGGLDLHALLDALPAGIPLSVEAPKRHLWQHRGYVEVARQSLAATRDWIATHERNGALR
ncbi:sugar phosphate isomerase/epimerase [Aminobacter lissarensis]|uniref:Sugar phosphate isomerase/epimerase n=1 Tax=Aminobacter carboxidus TaxID=376165 RepID=A0A8E1WK71_9HYPH|nr:TIM barrel protein [Aminobacter lissarensis]MBB6469099.1 sugar phosphate isomerase/epimerase [Aminobacter lissarensis]